MYRPIQLVGLLVLFLFCFGAITAVRFLYHYLKNPTYSGYIQSLVLGTGAVIVAVLLAVAALLAELIASNRRLLEDLRSRVRRIEFERANSTTELERLGIESTANAAWTDGRDDPPKGRAP